MDVAVSNTSHWDVVVGSSTRTERSEGPTFKDLRGRMAIAAVNCTHKTWLNHQTALTHMMEALSASDETSISPLLTADFDRSLRRIKRYSADRSDRFKRNMKSRAYSIQATAMAMLSPTGEPDTFCAVLTAAMRAKGLTSPELARAAGVPPSTMNFWVIGAAHPQPVGRQGLANRQRLARVESVLDLPYGALSGLVAGNEAALRKATRAQSKEQPTRSELLRRTVRRVPYVIDLPAGVREFYERFTGFKTAMTAGRATDGTKLRRRSRWRIRPGKLPRGEVVQECPAAAKELHFLKNVFSFAVLPAGIAEAEALVRQAIDDKSMWPYRPPISASEYASMAPLFQGLGMSRESLTIMDFVDAELLGAFIGWRNRRSGESGWTRSVLALAMSLVDPSYGFITQRVDFAWTCLGWPRLDVLDNPAEAAAQRERWIRHCTNLHAAIADLKREWNKDVKARDPKVVLAAILQLDEPMTPILSMIDAHAADRPWDRSSRQYARWLRNQLLLRMLFSNPLRNRNFCEMEYLEDNSGSVYRDVAGIWRLRFKPSDFKNDRGAASEAYDVPFPKTIQPLLTEYLLTARTIFGETEDRAVFIGCGKQMKPTRFCANALSALIMKVARDYLPIAFRGVPLRSHAARHIVATAFLKAHPGDYVALAHLLHDKLATVMAVYAFSQPEDGLKIYQEWLNI